MKMKWISIFGLLAAGLLLAVSGGLSQTRPTIVTQPSATPAPIPSPTIQEEDQVIKVDTELVNLNVRVVD
jgi:hypothetical protein